MGDVLMADSARVLMLLVLSILVTVACGSPGTPATTVATPTSSSAGGFATPVSAPSYPVTVTDDAGHSVTFDHPPQRIISLTPGHTETVYALGVGNRVLETDKYSDYPPENQPKAKLITYPKPNVEELVALQPDLIVVLVEGDDFTHQMEAHGIKVLKLFPKAFDGTLQDIELLGRVTGTEARAKQLTAAMHTREEAIIAKTKQAPKPKVLYELDASDPTKPFVAEPSGFFGNLVPLAGGQNIFDDLGTSSAQVSTEQIVARDPGIIILGDTTVPLNPQTPAMVKARHGWEQITAVRTDHIYAIDNAYLSRPGPRLIDGLEQLAKLIHPERFQ